MIRLRIVSRSFIRLLRWLFPQRNGGKSIARRAESAGPLRQAKTSGARFDEIPTIPEPVTDTDGEIATQTITLAASSGDAPYSDALATAGEAPPEAGDTIGTAIDEIPPPTVVIETTNELAGESSPADGLAQAPEEPEGVSATLVPPSESRENFNLLEDDTARNPLADEGPATGVAVPEQEIVESKETSIGVELQIEELLVPQDTQTNGEATVAETPTPSRADADGVEVMNREGFFETLSDSNGAVLAEVALPEDRVANQEEVSAASSTEGALTYAGLKPPRLAKPIFTSSEDRPRVRKAVSSSVESEARLRVHLVFNNRGEAIRALTLLPDRRDEMPDELQVAGTQGTFAFSRFRDDAYEGISLPDLGAALLGGVEWRGTPAANQRLRWVLRGREIYVLAPGPLIADLGGFVSAPRLLLNEENAVLARKTLRDDVLSALASAGCHQPTVIDNPALGVPSDWMLFMRVRPSQAVPMRDEQDVLNSLCPLTDIEPHFEGGIKLERQTWLTGHPPAIRFTGAVEDSFAPKIDGKNAQLTERGYISGGWDDEGQHDLWYADKIARYTIRRCAEVWDAWDAYGFGTGALICGAQVLPASGEQRRQVRVPRQNSILIGAEPGQVFNSQPRADLRFKDWVAMPPFDPVWAVPSNPAHLNKKTARVVAVGEIRPVRKISTRGLGRAEKSRIAAWCSAISEAGRKGLLIEGEEAQVAFWWREYRVEAKRLKRSLR